MPLSTLVHLSISTVADLLEDVIQKWDSAYTLTDRLSFGFGLTPKLLLASPGTDSNSTDAEDGPDPSDHALTRTNTNKEEEDDEDYDEERDFYAALQKTLRERGEFGGK
ncbi:hypothetical protein HK102_011046, partial [Quaeritorhiza haematococci]